MEPQSAAFLTKANSVTTDLKKKQLNLPAVLLRPTSSASRGEIHVTTPMDDWLMSSLNIQATCMFDKAHGSSEHFGPEEHNKRAFLNTKLVLWICLTTEQYQGMVATGGAVGRLNRDEMMPCWDNIITALSPTRAILGQLYTNTTFQGNTQSQQLRRSGFWYRGSPTPTS